MIICTLNIVANRFFPYVSCVLAELDRRVMYLDLLTTVKSNIQDQELQMEEVNVKIEEYCAQIAMT